MEGEKKLQFHLSIKTKNQPIKRVEYVKYLGIYFDYNMKWDIHVQHIIIKNQISHIYFC